MQRRVLLIAFLGLFTISPLTAQSSLEEKSSRELLEPLNPMHEANSWAKKLWDCDPVCWMIRIESGPGVSPTGASAFYLTYDPLYSRPYKIHFARIKRCQPAELSQKSKPDETYSADIHADVAQELIEAWRFSLSRSVYQEPSGENGMVAFLFSPPYYFGFRRRYFGQNQGLVRGEAKIIQELGELLIEYPGSPQSQKGDRDMRIQAKIQQLVQTQKNAVDSSR